MDLEQRSIERIAKDFAQAEEASVVELLTGYAGPEPARVTWDILELSKGSLEKVRQYVEAAKTDYRDVLYWAEYYDRDPLARGRDPKSWSMTSSPNWKAKTE
jgi:hypothetical protein